MADDTKLKLTIICETYKNTTTNTLEVEDVGAADGAQFKKDAEKLLNETILTSSYKAIVNILKEAVNETD